MKNVGLSHLVWPQKQAPNSDVCADVHLTQLPEIGLLSVPSVLHEALVFVAGSYMVLYRFVWYGGCCDIWNPLQVMLKYSAAKTEETK